MSEKLGLGLIISSAEIKEDVSLLLCFLMCKMNSFLPWVKHWRHLFLLLLIISVIISLLLIHLVHSSSSQSLPWNSKQCVETEISLLPSNKSHGLYFCPARGVLESSSSVLSRPLAHIMDNSVLTGLQYPSKLKH